ncbi:nucleoside ABC transporter membrane protein [Oscillibacter sp. PC13]|uniref:ABC transporter permease n=1 Tax=Oscillibacter sp. PC13 TaxID=1855299 RepID=UPI0008E89C2F|nr:ABC transporter permease [Oscillibacter sp. PC13]SFQ03234.1 nucleoside ABC transporter membrane protein [Oscillibacter sp. PC13]
MEDIASFLSSLIRMSTPLLIAGLGLVFSANAGIVNIGTEGFMLLGALMGCAGSYWTGSAFAGAVIAMVATMVFSAVFAFFTLNMQADQTVVGAAVNIFASGLTITLNRIVFDTTNGVPVIETFNAMPIPGLSSIPVVGVLFNQSLVCYLAFLAVPVVWYIMKKTHIGLEVRSVGENPRASDTLGINILATRWWTILLSGLLSGLAGAYMSMGQLSFFTEGMVSGKGFMALAVVVLGCYSPVGVMGASLIFGAGMALQYRLQAANTGIPYQIITMLPYVITLVAVCGFIRKSRAPAATAVAYTKE